MEAPFMGIDLKLIRSTESSARPQYADSYMRATPTCEKLRLEPHYLERWHESVPHRCGDEPAVTEQLKALKECSPQAWPITAPASLKRDKDRRYAGGLFEFPGLNRSGLIEATSSASAGRPSTPISGA